MTLVGRLLDTLRYSRGMAAPRYFLARTQLRLLELRMSKYPNSTSLEAIRQKGRVIAVLAPAPIRRTTGRIVLKKRRKQPIPQET